MPHRVQPAYHIALNASDLQTQQRQVQDPEVGVLQSYQGPECLNIERRKFAQILGTVIVDGRGPIYMGKCNLRKHLNDLTLLFR